MESSRRVPPVWLMGLSNSTFGLTSGIVFFAMPQLLAAERVPEATIAGITAAAMSSNFWAVIFGPILDVRFSRRWYATIFAALASILVFIATMNLHHLIILEIALVLGVAAAALSTAALCGWLSVICSHKEKNKLSAWVNIAIIGGIGVASLSGSELVRHFSLRIAAALLGMMVFLPTAIFLIMPAPSPDRRLAGESFGQFAREVLALFRRREVLIALVFFVSPCGSFALTNILAGLGGDFHASARMVSLAGGVGAFFPGIAGCLLFPIVARRLPLRLFYLANGVVGGLFTLSLIVLPRAPWSFTLALVGEFLFQAASYCTQVGIVFETIGQNNPLAATTYAFLTAATNIPVTYMMVADGRGYAMGGVAGSLGVDAGISIAASLLLGLMLYWLSDKAFGQRPEIVEPVRMLAQEE